MKVKSHQHDGGSAIELPPELESLVQSRADLPACQIVHAGALEVTLLASDPGMIAWVQNYLAPLFALGPSDDSHYRYRVSCTYDDRLVGAVGRWAMLDKNATVQKGFEGTPMSRHVLSNETFVYVDRRSGVVHYIDASSNNVSTIVSTRTKWPSLEFSRVVREIACRQLESSGYNQFHAGCVGGQNGYALLVGDKGAGKTTLTLLAMSCGSTYLANDRVFVSVDNDDVIATPFPLSVAVGMGTLTQFQSLLAVVDDPLLTTYPRMRWDIDKIRALPRGEWLNQSDKVEFTPSELAQLLSAPAPAARGKITAIVVPAVRKGACVPSCRRLGADEARQLLERNRFVRANNATYPAWTDLAFASPSIGNVLETLLELPTYELMFGVSADENNSGKLAHDLLQRAIGCA